MDLKLANSEQTMTLSDDVFSKDFNEPLIHQVVNACLARQRSGTKAQKTRAEVRGGGIKPWRQKGTGRARAGTIRSPIWRKGGVTFAAKPRSFDQKVNKKMYRGAIRSIVSELLRQGRITVVEQFDVEGHKTKEILKKFTEYKLNGEILIITHDLTENLIRSGGNLPYVDMCDAATAVANPDVLIKKDTIVFTKTAIQELESFLK